MTEKAIVRSRVSGSAWSMGEETRIPLAPYHAMPCTLHLSRFNALAMGMVMAAIVPSVGRACRWPCGWVDEGAMLVGSMEQRKSSVITGISTVELHAMMGPFLETGRIRPGLTLAGGV